MTLYRHYRSKDQLALQHFERVRGFFRRLAEKARARDADGLARQWHLLILGSIIAACAGDRDASRPRPARRAGATLRARAPEGELMVTLPK